MWTNFLKKYTHIILSNTNYHLFHNLFHNRNRKSDSKLTFNLEHWNAHSHISPYDSHTPIILATIIPTPSLHSFHATEKTRPDQTGQGRKQTGNIESIRVSLANWGRKEKEKETRLGEKLVHRSRIGMSRTRTTRFRVFVGSRPPSPFPCPRPKKLDFAACSGTRWCSISWKGGAIVTGGRPGWKAMGSRNGFSPRSLFFSDFVFDGRREGGRGLFFFFLEKIWTE